MTYKQNYEIIEAMTHRHPDFADAAEKYGTDLQAIWDHKSNPIQMLDLFFESNYRESYVPELREFRQWLRREEHLDDIRDSNGTNLSDKQLLDMLYLTCRQSIEKLVCSARDDARWDAAVAAVGTGFHEPNQAPGCQETREIEIANKLRGIIPNPFSPKIRA